MYRIYETNNFEKKVKKILNKSEFQEYIKFKEKLKTGIILGKPLNYDFFREEKISSKRLYFLIYREISIILFVNLSKKKYQQETINEIKYLLPEFKKLAYNMHNLKKN